MTAGQTRPVVLVRHGQSQWNVENRFTGWTDVPLTEAGIAEARRAGRLLKARGYAFDVAYISCQRRARQTLDLMLEELGALSSVSVIVNWRLNERHYGALQGLDKTEALARYGAEQFQRWRRGYNHRPPPVDYDDPRHPRFDPLYQSLPPELLPASESLADTYARVVPYWEEAIAPRVAAGERVLISAHGNSLRALVKYLDGLSDEAIESIEIPTGVPLLYEFDAQMKALQRCFLDAA